MLTQLEHRLRRELNLTWGLVYKIWFGLFLLLSFVLNVRHPWQASILGGAALSALIVWCSVNLALDIKLRWKSG
jgi:uncharacterized BrkB/YihY/UPF0761 family membrane protein